MQKMIRSLETARGTVILREANLADAEQFRDLRLNGLQDSPTAFSADYQVNFSHPMSFWEGRLTFDEHGIIFFAELDSKLIGMTGIRKGESPKTKHGAYVWGVYIRPEWRGLHIAETLIEMCADWAREQDVAILKLGVMVNNEAAVRCYKRIGFTVYGTEPRALFYEGQYYDEYLMAFNLDSPEEKNMVTEAEVQQLRSRVNELEDQLKFIYRRLGINYETDPNTDAINNPQIQVALRNSNKIEAIKIYREQTGVGLAEAKQAIDQVERFAR